MPTKWWGWGDEAKSFALADPERFWSFLERRLGAAGESPRLESLDAIALPPSRLEAPVAEAFRQAVGEKRVSAESGERAVHSLGKTRAEVHLLGDQLPVIIDIRVREQRHHLRERFLTERIQQLSSDIQ